MNIYLPQRFHVRGMLCLLISLSGFIPFGLYAQTSDCPNADFSMNNFTNWTGAVGNCCPINVPTPGIVPGRHTIMAPGTDALTGGGLPLVPNGFTTSARLGNSGTGAQAEMLRYTLTVTPQNALFVYNYAVVLQDPGHSAPEQPRFELQVRDPNGQVIPCTFYQVAAGNNIPGFNSFGSTRWKPWTQVGVDLTTYMGQQVTIEARTGDCSQSGHYGYGYITATCGPMDIHVDYCLGDTIAYLNAPDGFQSYLWSTGATTQAIAISNPAQVQSPISVTVVSVSGCQATLSVNLVPEIVQANFTTSNGCNGTLLFTDLSTSNQGTVTQWQWNFGDGSQPSSQQNPVHTYGVPGPYNVTLQATSPGGCTHDTTILVTAPPLIIADFSVPTDPCGLNKTFTNTTQLVGGGSLQSSQWFVNNVPVSNQTSLTHTFPGPGTYTVSLIAVNSSNCSDTSTQQVTIYAIPTADFSAPTVCHNTPTQFTDLSVVQGGGLSQWQWNYGNSNSSGTQSPGYVYPNPGTYNVSLIVTGPGGCTDTIIRTVNVTPMPVACINLPANCGLTQGFNDCSTISGGNISTYNWDFNPGTSTSQNPMHVFVNPGNYNISLTVTSDSGCVNTTTVPYTANAIPVAAFNSPQTCHPNAVPFNNTSTVQGNGGLSYQWSFGDNNTSTQASPQHPYGSSGNYNVTLIVTGPGGCTDTITQVIYTPPTPVAGFTLPVQCDLTDFFQNTSSISDNTNLTYDWDFGDGSPISHIGSPTHTYGGPGNYNVSLTVTSIEGCSSTLVQQNTAYAIPVAAFNSPQTCHPNAVPFNNTSTVQGNGGLSYQWNFGDNNTSTQTSPQHPYGNAGNYTVTLIATGPGGCADTITQAIYTPPTPVAGFTLPVQCDLTDFFQNTSSISDNTNLTYDWDFGDGSPISHIGSPTHTYGGPGNYNVSLTVTSIEGCSSTLVQQNTAYAIPVASFNGPTTCHPNAVPFNNTSTVQGNGGLSYQWNFGDNNTSTQASPQHPYGNAGSYTVTLIATGPGGCADTITSIVHTPPTPSPGFTLPVACNLTDFFQNTSSISNNSNLIYSWNFGDGSSPSTQVSPTHTYQAPGTYSVTLTVTSDSGCVATLVQQNPVYDIPVAAFSAPMVCHGSATVFTDNSTNQGGIIQHQWNFGDNTTQTGNGNPGHSYANPGYYTVGLIVTGPGGCTDTIQQQVYVPASPVAQFAYPTDCGLTNAFTDQSTIVLDSIISWQWNFGDQNTSGQQHPAHTYANQGNWPVVLIVTSNYGCTDTILHSFQNRAIPVADFSHTAACFGSANTFTDQSTVQLDSITQWNWDLVYASSTSQNGSFVFPSDGLHQVQLIVWASNGCSDTVNYPITVYPQPIANFAVPEVCNGLPVAFADQSTINNPGSIQNWSWNLDQGSSTQQHPSITYSTYGNYTATLAVTSNHGCVDSVSRPVLVWPRPEIHFDINPRAGCAPLVGQFSNTTNIVQVPGPNAVIQYVWNFGDNHSSTSMAPSHVYMEPGVYDVTLTAISDKGCDTSVTRANFISVYPVPFAEFKYNPEYPTTTNPVVEFTNLSVGGISYSWTFGDGGVSGAEDPIHKYPGDTGAYVVTLEVTNEFGCMDTVEHFLIIKPGYTVYIPNTFTPNSDGDNETFKIYGEGIKEAELLIYDRWGEKLAEMGNKEPMDKGWDGTHGGKAVKQDVYVYRARVRDISGKWHDFEGLVNVLK